MPSSKAIQQILQAPQEPYTSRIGFHILAKVKTASPKRIYTLSVNFYNTKTPVARLSECRGWSLKARAGLVPIPLELEPKIAAMTATGLSMLNKGA